MVVVGDGKNLYGLEVDRILGESDLSLIHISDNESPLSSVPVDLLYVNSAGRFATNFLGTDGVGKLILKPGAPDPSTDPSLDGTYAQLLDKILQQRSQEYPFVQFYDPIRKQQSYIGAAPVKTGDWVLVLTVTRDELLAPIRSTIIENFIVSNIGILLVAVLILTSVNRLSARIGRAVTVAQQVAAGDLTACLLYTSRCV